MLFKHLGRTFAGQGIHVLGKPQFAAGARTTLWLCKFRAKLNISISWSPLKDIWLLTVPEVHLRAVLRERIVKVLSD